MMDTLISGFAEENRNHSSHNDGTNSERQLDHSASTSYSGSFTNKLSKFTLATFDDEGDARLRIFFFYLCKYSFATNY